MSNSRLVKFRLIHVITDLDVGGSETMLKRLLMQESDKDNILVISLTDIGKIGLEIKDLGVEVQALHMRGALSFPVALIKLVKILKKHSPDIIQSWMYHADLLAGIAARLCGIKNIVWGVRGTYPPIGNKQTYMIMKLCAYLSRFVPRKIIYVSKSALDSHISYGYDSRKSLYIHNGIQIDSVNYDENGRALIRQQLGLADTDIVIGTLGRFHPDKGQDLLLQSTQQVLSKYSNVVFVFVGRDCEKILETSGSAGIEQNAKNRIYFIREQRNIQQWLSAFDIYCLPSRTEGFPNSLLEAMLIGLPCIATPAGDTKIIAADTAFITDEISSQSLYEKLDSMLSMTTEQRAQLGNKASNHAKQQFSIENCYKKFSDTYKEIM